MHRLFSLLFLSFPLLSTCQSGYSGYKLDVRQDNDPGAVLYETANTATSNRSTLSPTPDVLLNASVHVGEMSIRVDNLTAKINVDAQVLQLLHFHAGVHLSIDRVSLLIQNVTARVYREARLGHLVAMVDDVLDSIDLNPVLAELGNGLGSIGNETAGLAGHLKTMPASSPLPASLATTRTICASRASMRVCYLRAARRGRRSGCMRRLAACFPWP